MSSSSHELEVDDPAVPGEAAFDGGLSTVTSVTPLRTIEEITNEQMLFQASPEFAWDNGGPITREVLEALTSHVPLEPTLPDCPHPVIDTKVHMLMPGHTPAIPGWHCDHTPRSDYNSHPDPLRANPAQDSYTVLVGSEKRIAPTLFVAEPLTIPFDPQRVWASCHDFVEAAADRVSIVEADDGQLLWFGGRTLPRASAARTRGWRWFFRLSFVSTPPQDQIRRQVMVYAPAGGW